MFNPSLTPIQTPYAGYRMRSRLEARWAVFFDALQLKWRYEPDSYPCNGTAYLPDFLVTNLTVADGDPPVVWASAAHIATRVYLEVKPCGYDPARDAWHADFGRNLPFGLVVVTGMPPGYTCGRNGGYRHDEEGEVRLFTDAGVWRHCQFGQCLYCDSVQWLVIPGEVARPVCPACDGWLCERFGDDEVADAAYEARRERFGLEW